MDPLLGLIASTNMSQTDQQGPHQPFEQNKHDVHDAQVSLGTSISGDGEPTGGPLLPKRLHGQSQVRPPSNEAFFFVESTSSMKGKRSHVMKHHIREKRRQLAKSLGVDMSCREGRPARYLPWTKKEEQENSRTDCVESNRLTSQGSALMGKTGSARLLDSGATKDVDSSHNLPLRNRSSESPYAQAVLGVSKADPFDTLALSLSKEDEELFDIWARKLTYWSGQNYHIKVSAFKQARQHPLTFKVVILTYCTRYLAHLHGQTQTKQSISYVSESERSFRKYRHEASDPTDDVATMVLVSFAVQEERYGSRRRAENLISSAMEAMRPRMGQNRTVETFMHWVHYTMAARSIPLHREDASHIISFLHNAESMAISHSQQEFLSQAPQRQSAIQFRTTLHMLLSSGPCPTRVPHKDRFWVVKYDSLHALCRTASLLYVASALWDYRASADKCARFLDAITKDLMDKGLDREPGTETLLWTLLENSYDPDLKDPRRAWYVGRLMRIIKELTPELHFQFCELLLSFLMLRPPDLGMSISKFEQGLWEYVKKSQALEQ